MADAQPVEVEARFECNYRVNPNDPYVMARACCALRETVMPGVIRVDIPAGADVVQVTWERLLARCQQNVNAFIAGEQASAAGQRGEL